MTETASPQGDHKIIQRERRKDGSERKPLRVRAGFTPQEEVRRYQAPGARRRMANQTNNSDTGKSVEPKEKIEEEIKIVPVKAAAPQKSKEELREEKQAELKSSLKRTKKKLRQIEDLKSKVDSGAITPNEDQQNKLSQHDAVQEEVDTLLLQLNDLAI